MMREGGLPLADLFDRVRLRVNEVTSGAQVPWDSSKVETSFVFFERTADAPPPVAAVEQTSALFALAFKTVQLRCISRKSAKSQDRHGASAACNLEVRAGCVETGEGLSQLSPPGSPMMPEVCKG
jgi:uncharacterized caspase-like protein